MSEIQNRRRNFRLFEFLVSRFTDAELRTMAECVQDELDYREDRQAHTAEPQLTEREQFREERRLLTPHRNHSAEPRATEPRPQVIVRRRPSGTRSKSSTGTDG